MKMAKKEINIELLLGKRVLALNGKSIGRLEEIHAELHQGECFIKGYSVGSYAVLERLAALSISREILHLFGATRRGRGYKVPWNKMDLTDPKKPRLLCSVQELEQIGDEED
jgi:sporulation protein YlmC with PRC-barrel domain